MQALSAGKDGETDFANKNGQHWIREQRKRSAIRNKCKGRDWTERMFCDIIFVGKFKKLGKSSEAKDDAGIYPGARRPRS
jgi:hypothetical protein